MNTYYEENKALLDCLQNNVHMEVIHNLEMAVKDIPDPVSGTGLDPRIYEIRKSEELAGNPLAEYLEIPVKLIREQPGYPNRDITSGEIVAERRTIDGRNGEIPIFLFHPAKSADIGKPRPAMVFIHGGAFIAGGTKVVENFCRLLAELADMVVIGVDYRLSPEHHFPVGLYDCYDTVNWVYEHATELSVRKECIAVGGDSAGGTLAIGCSILEQGLIRKNRICYEALLYPGVLVDNFRLEDYRWRMSDYDIRDEDTFAASATVSLKALTAEMPLLYMGEEGHVRNPLAAPLCQESLFGLPETLMILCEYDYLRLSGEAFGRKMQRDGVRARTVLYRGMDHAFIDKIGDCPQAYDVGVLIAGDIRRICGNLIF